MIDIADLKMDFMVLIALPALSLFLFVTYLIVIGILRKILSKDLQSSDEEKVSTLVILGSGGHTTEMLRLVSALSDEKYTPKKFMLAETDSSSIHKLNDNNYDQNIIFIPRSREVRQSWITTIFSTIKTKTEGSRNVPLQSIAYLIYASLSRLVSLQLFHGYDEIIITARPLISGGRVTGYALRISPARTMKFEYAGKYYIAFGASNVTYGGTAAKGRLLLNIDKYMDELLVNYLKANPKKE